MISFIGNTNRATVTAKSLIPVLYFPLGYGFTTFQAFSHKIILANKKDTPKGVPYPHVRVASVLPIILLYQTLLCQQTLHFIPNPLVFDDIERFYMSLAILENNIESNLSILRLAYLIFEDNM